MGAGNGGSSSSGSGEELHRKRGAFLRLLGPLLALDAQAALAPGQQASGWLLASFLQILNLRCAAQLLRTCIPLGKGAAACGFSSTHCWTLEKSEQGPHVRGALL